MQSWPGRLQIVRQAIIQDMRGRRYLPFGAALLVLAMMVVVAFYLNHPQVELYDDSGSYFGSAQAILAHFRFADPSRLPGYPLLIALVFATNRAEFNRVLQHWHTEGVSSVPLTANAHLAALSAVQGVLFVLATLEIYALMCLVLRRAWMGFVVGLIVAINTYLLGYVKEIVSDGLALFVTVSLALAVVLFVRWPGARTLWLVAVCTLALFMTRAEWIYLPVPLFAYLLIIAARRGQMRRLLPHAIGAMLLLYGILGSYVAANAVQNGYLGVTQVQNVNLLGKVMQYGMQDLAPPAYAPITRQLDAYIAQGGYEPYGFFNRTPELSANHYVLAGRFSMAVIERHPALFVRRSIPVFFNSSSMTQVTSHVRPTGPFAPLLHVLQAISARVYSTFEFFLVFAMFWAVVLFRGRSSLSRVAESMGAVSLLILYGLTLTTVGTYSDYGRIHVEFTPLLIVVICGTLLLLASLYKQVLARVLTLWSLMVRGRVA